MRRWEGEPLDLLARPDRSANVTRFPVRYTGVVAAVLVSLAIGCSERSDPEATEPTTAAATTAPAALTTTPPGLSSVDWRNATVHTELCGGTGTETLEDGVGFTHSSKWSPWWIVQISLGEPVVYGDVDLDGSDEAVVPLWCNNGGGTAAGQLGFGLEVFTGSPTDMRLLGTIVPEPPPEPQHTSYIATSKSRIEQGAVTVQELFYGAGDGTCCPSGRRESVWRYDNGSLRRESSVVTVEPKSRR